MCLIVTKTTIMNNSSNARFTSLAQDLLAMTINDNVSNPPTRPDIQSNTREICDNHVMLLLLSRPNMSALEIAHCLFGENGKAKDVNPRLYKLFSDGLLIKTNGRPPLWSVRASNEDGEIIVDDLDSKIVNLLKQSKDINGVYKKFKNAEIRRHVSEHFKTRGLMNRRLYSMMNRGLVCKTTERGSKTPLWSYNCD